MQVLQSFNSLPSIIMLVVVPHLFHSLFSKFPCKGLCFSSWKNIVAFIFLPLRYLCLHLNSSMSLLQLKDDTQVEAKDEGPVEWISYWKPNITINLVDDFTRYVCSELYLIYLC